MTTPVFHIVAAVVFVVLAGCAVADGQPEMVRFFAIMASIWAATTRFEAPR